ncbi:hypothetical protein ABC977_16510 [Thioalkalicoccus limnaeus]|uniref:N-acetyltransferase domain-containing protein n=1 Tax=Thioalkalicoccus limnaeus TaxID=120681 RepID=A0ABV4BL16_9GAMM
MNEPVVTPLPVTSVFRKETILNGTPVQIDCIEVGGQLFSVRKGLLTVACLEDEWYEDLKNPAGVIAGLRQACELRADLLTFWQRPPYTEPVHPYYYEWESVASLPVTSYQHWWDKQIKSRVRNHIRKAEKEGLVVRETLYDDEFVRGMTAIFNESPIRQGRRFWHYGKDFETVRRQFSRYISREYMVGAYFQGQMVGFMMLGNAGRFGLTGQIISSLAHRDKAPNHAMVAKAVEICAAHNLSHLVYYYWTDDSLSEFKRRCGFEETRLPRYYVPLTWRGELALRLGAHRRFRAMVPASIRAMLKRARARWYGRVKS